MVSFNLKSGLTRRALIVLEGSLFVVALIWIATTLAAYYAARKSSVDRLRLASRLDPLNAEYHLRLGRVFQYSVTDINPERALGHFRRATELNPHSAQPWLDWAAALEFQGQTDEAETGLRRAAALAPNLPSAQWAIGNFFLLHGNVDEAFKHFRIVLIGSSKYDGILFDRAWKASEDADKILNEVIPRHLATEFRYLNYLASKERYAEAQAVWGRIAESPESFPARDVAGYIDKLIRARWPAEAHRVWTDLLRKGIVRKPQRDTSGNLIASGDFEDELTRIGFDWRVGQRPGAYTAPDQVNFRSVGHSMLIQFDGKTNLHYRNLYQFVKVTPGQSYQLRAYLRTEGITTDSGPRLEVRDAYAPPALYKLSDALTGSTGGWSPVTLDFATGPSTELIVVGVTRVPSRKLDNLIAGKVWIDDVTLTPAR